MAALQYTPAFIHIWTHKQTWLHIRCYTHLRHTHTYTYIYNHTYTQIDEHRHAHRHTQRHTNTEQPLLRDSLTQTSFYRGAFTRESERLFRLSSRATLIRETLLHGTAFTRRPVYTEQLLHIDFIQSNFYTFFWCPQEEDARYHQLQGRKRLKEAANCDLSTPKS